LWCRTVRQDRHWQGLQEATAEMRDVEMRTIVSGRRQFAGECLMQHCRACRSALSIVQPSPTAAGSAGGLVYIKTGGRVDGDHILKKGLNIEQ